MSTDPLAPLLGLDGVADALESARNAVDRVLGRRALRLGDPVVSTEITLRVAVASAALEGHRHEVEHVRLGLVDDPVLAGAVRVSERVPAIAPLWARAPAQALARLHLLAGRGVVEDTALGRPRSGAAASERLGALVRLVATGTRAPGLLVAAVVHGELLALGPFAGVNGVVARAAARLTLVSTGLDPTAVLPLDVGHEARGPEYVGSAGAFATGTRDGLRSWLHHYARAVEVAAGVLAEVADAGTVR